MPHSRSYTRCLASCFWRSHYQPQSWCRLVTSKLHGQPRQPFQWNYFLLLTGRIEKIFSSFFKSFSHEPVVLEKLIVILERVILQPRLVRNISISYFVIFSFLYFYLCKSHQFIKNYFLRKCLKNSSSSTSRQHNHPTPES